MKQVSQNGPQAESCRILQVWKRHDLGLDWTVSFLSDGSASFYNGKTDQRLDLPKYSVETLRAAIIKAAAEGRA